VFARVTPYAMSVEGPGEAGPRTPPLTQENLDERIRYIREHELPVGRQMAGFKGIIRLVDRERNKTIGITLWESEEAMRANKLPSEIGEAPDGIILRESIEKYEVTLYEV
jgi:heme-degrading monooxygenase HmoA